MKTFREWLIESSQGVYIGMKLSNDTVEKLQEFIKTNNQNAGHNYSA